MPAADRPRRGISLGSCKRMIASCQDIDGTMVGKDVRGWYKSGPACGGVGSHTDLPLSETRDYNQGTCVRVPKMKGTTILLLGAATLVAYASAHPYSKIPDEYNYKKTSSNSNTNSYSQSNHNEADVNGAYHGQVFSGSKASGYSTNGGSHSQSSSFSSSSLNGNVPLSLYGFPGLSQTSIGYDESSLALGNPGTAGLVLSDKAPGYSSGSFSSSYGTSNAGSSDSGSSDGQIVAGGHDSGLYGSGGQVGIESALNTGIKGGSSGSNSGIFGSAGGASFGQGGLSTSGSSGAPGSGYFAQVGSQPGAVQYWWNAPGSPFEPGKPTGGCNSNACSLAGNFDLSKGSGGAHASNQGGQVVLSIKTGNPFLNGGQTGSGSGFISSGSSSIGQSTIGSSSGSSSGAGAGAGAGTGSNSHPTAGSQNPFFSGSYSGGAGGSGLNAGSSFGTGSGSHSTSNAGAIASSASSSHGSSGSSTGFIGVGNPFFNSGSGSAQIPQGSGQAPTATPQGFGFANGGAGSINPFFTPGSGSAVLTPPIAKFPDQGFPHPTSLPGFSIETSSISGSLAPQHPTVGISIPQSTVSFGSSESGGLQGQEGQILSFPSQSPIEIGGSSGSYQGQISQIPSFVGSSTISPGGSLNVYSTPSPFIPEQPTDEGLTVSCSGQGRICVLENLCINGKFNGNGQGLLQIKTETQYCKVGLEVCCILTEYQSGSSSSFGFGSSGSSSNSNSGSSNNFGQTGSFDQSQNSGIFGQNGQSGSYDQSQQQESFNFGAHSGSHGSAGSGSSFGNQGGISVTPGFPSGFSTVTPAPHVVHDSSFGNQGGISVTPGFPSGFSTVTPATHVVHDSSFGSQAGIAVTPGFHSGFPTVTPAPHVVSVTPVVLIPQPTIVSSSGGNSGFGSAHANAHADASGQAGSDISGGFIQHTSSFGSDDQTFVKVKPSQSSGGLFGSSDNSGEDLSGGDAASGSAGASASNGYLPPIGSEPSSNVPAFSNPPEEDGGQSEVVIDKRPPPGPSFPFAPIAPPIGCAAALICVEEQYCTMEGVISPEPVGLTSQQIERRAPLSSCRNPDNGVVGKCCRDPNYVDPWPTGNLPANYSGGFDEQGFPTYLNIGKVRPPKKQPPPTKGGFRQPEKFFNFPPLNEFASTIQTNLQENPYFAPLATGVQNFINGFNGNTEQQDTPAIIPVAPDNTAGSKNYDLSATNQSPTIIAPHTPGAQCGLRNKVQRPSGLDKDDTAFGEIPWQAMVLSTADRKLLCSGAIVSPNAVLTAAHCVNGFGPGEVSIKAGEWKLGYELKHEEPLPFEIVKVSNIVTHPGFQSGSSSHDIAILFLEHPVALDQHVDVLCLGDIPQPKPGRKCIATGWGKIVLQVNVAGALMHSIDVDVVPQDECLQRLQGAESQIEVDNSLTCTKAKNQWNNMCQVDVGGPLACDRGDGSYELTGIYSQDTGCLPTNQVATFALIDTNWVKQSLLYPPQLQVPNYEVDLPNLGESPSSSNVQPSFGAQLKKPAATCDCQKSHLPPDLNQYLPPV